MTETWGLIHPEGKCLLICDAMNQIRSSLLKYSAEIGIRYTFSLQIEEIRKEKRVNDLKEDQKTESVSVTSDSAALWTVAHQVPLSIEFSRQEDQNELPFPFPGDLPNPGLELKSPASQADSLPSEPPGKTQNYINVVTFWCTHYCYHNTLKFILKLCFTSPSAYRKLMGYKNFCFFWEYRLIYSL